MGAVFKQKVSVSANYIMLSVTADRLSIFKKKRGRWPAGEYRFLGDRDEANAKTATTSKEMASWSASHKHGGIFQPWNGISRCFSAFAHTDNYLITVSAAKANENQPTALPSIRTGHQVFMFERLNGEWVTDQAFPMVNLGEFSNVASK